MTKQAQKARLEVVMNRHCYSLDKDHCSDTPCSGCMAAHLVQANYCDLSLILADLESLRSEWEGTFTVDGIGFAIDIVKRYMEGKQ